MRPRRSIGRLGLPPKRQSLERQKRPVHANQSFFRNLLRACVLSSPVDGTDPPLGTLAGIGTCECRRVFPSGTTGKRNPATAPCPIKGGWTSVSHSRRHRRQWGCRDFTPWADAGMENALSQSPFFQRAEGTSQDQVCVRAVTLVVS